VALSTFGVWSTLRGIKSHFRLPIWEEFPILVIKLHSQFSKELDRTAQGQKAFEKF
jgi:hypothetical protein